MGYRSRLLVLASKPYRLSGMPATGAAIRGFVDAGVTVPETASSRKNCSESSFCGLTSNSSCDALAGSWELSGAPVAPLRIPLQPQSVKHPNRIADNHNLPTFHPHVVGLLRLGWNVRELKLSGVADRLCWPGGDEPALRVGYFQ